MIFAALPALGPVLFGWQLKQAGYGWLEYIAVQELWERQRAWPWSTLQDAWIAVDGGWFSAFVDDPSWSTITSSGFRNEFANSDTVELIFTVLFFLLAVIGLRILPLYQSALVWPALLIPLFGPSVVHPLMSVPRFGIVLFPLYIVVAFLVRDRRTALPALAISLLLLIIFTAQFAQAYWAS